MQLRPYQNQAVDAVIAYLKQNQGMPLISAATGTGKSLIIAGLIQRLLAANPEIHVMCVTHAAELIEQNEGKLKAIWPDAPTAIYSASLKQKEMNRITFGGIQSLWRAKIETPINLLIVDEAHSISRKEKSMWGNFIGMLREANPRLRIIGLSATTFRMDSGNLTTGEDAMFNDVVFDYGLKAAIDDGWLAPLTAKYTKTTYDIFNVGKIAGEFNLKELEAATNTTDKNRQACAEIVEAGLERRSWIVFCNGIAHSFAIRDEMRRLGVSCETVTGETPWDEREKILARHRDGELKCITNNAVLTTGVDLPAIDLIAMLRHTMSGGLLVQMAGRGTRAVIDLNPYSNAIERRAAIKNSPKPNCIFLDFARNIERHGFLDEITGKDKSKKDGVAPMKACPECATICHAAAKHCPDCGCVFPMEEKVLVSKEAYKGELFSGAVIKKVESVSYHAHNLNREGKTPCLMVIYQHEDGSNTREYICLQHQGFAQQKAKAWWKARGGQDVDAFGMQLIVDSGICDRLLVPESIMVKKEGKYDRITNYIRLGKPAQPVHVQELNTLAEMEDIPF